MALAFWSASEFFSGFSRIGFEASPDLLRALVVLFVASLAHVIGTPQQWQRGLARCSPWMQGVAYAAVAILVYVFSPATNQFIYFQF